MNGGTKRIVVSPTLYVSREDSTAGLYGNVFVVQEYGRPNDRVDRRAGVVIARADLPGFLAAISELCTREELGQAVVIEAQRIEAQRIEAERVKPR